MSFEVDIGQCSHCGPRPALEDYCEVRHSPDAGRGLIAALADGVSGGGGALAAQTAVRALLADYFATPATWAATVALNRLISAHNTWAADHHRRAGDIGLTTLTAIAIRGQTWSLAHVGDSRAWRLGAIDGRTRLMQPGTDTVPDEDLQCLTQDHAFDHPDMRSRLTRAIGLDDAVRIDFAEGELRVGDTLVLTSDGVHGALKPLRLAQLARQGTAQQAAEALVHGALAAGGRDNATALVMRIRALDSRGLPDEQADARRLPSPPPLKLGELLDGHAVTARIGDNGVHSLYQVRHQASGALRVLKALHPARANDPEERAMLAHEAWLGLRLHEQGAEGFVRVHERAAQAAALYVLFDWHAGATLEQRLAQRPALADAVAAAISLTRALGRLHRLGVVHRDIKPGNLHHGDDGAWRVLDLGVATSGRESASLHQLHAGTPSYMNPEQWDGQAADAGSDLFALGVSLYQWLGGRLPYGEIEPYQSARYRRDPPSLTGVRPDVPMWLDHILRKAVACDARERFETAEEMLLALERGAARALPAPQATPLMGRDPLALWQMALAVSLLLNVLLIGWLLFLPR